MHDRTFFQRDDAHRCHGGLHFVDRGELRQHPCRYLQIGQRAVVAVGVVGFVASVLREEEETGKPQKAGGCSFESANRKYLVEKITDYFEDHYAEKISLDRIAGNMYLSTFYVSRIFKAETGNTPIHYLIDIRLTKAYNLLTQNLEMSIQEIAAQVGYEDAYHFSKLFKKKYGVAPSAVRRRIP